MLTDIDGAAVEAARDRLAAEGATCHAFRLDVTDPESILDVRRRCTRPSADRHPRQQRRHRPRRRLPRRAARDPPAHLPHQRRRHGRGDPRLPAGDPRRSRGPSGVHRQRFRLHRTSQRDDLRFEQVGDHRVRRVRARRAAPPGAPPRARDDRVPQLCRHRPFRRRRAAPFDQAARPQRARRRHRECGREAAGLAADARDRQAHAAHPLAAPHQRLGPRGVDPRRRPQHGRLDRARRPRRSASRYAAASAPGNGATAGNSKIRSRQAFRAICPQWSAVRRLGP